MTVNEENLATLAKIHRAMAPDLEPADEENLPPLRRAIESQGDRFSTADVIAAWKQQPGQWEVHPDITRDQYDRIEARMASMVTAELFLSGRYLMVGDSWNEALEQPGDDARWVSVDEALPEDVEAATALHKRVAALKIDDMIEALDLIEPDGESN